MTEPFGNKWKKYKIHPTMLTQSGNSVDSIKLNTGDSGLKGVQGVTGTQGTQGAPGENASSEFPIGGIIMWSGAIVDIPVNWALCDGNDNRPDLVDKFIVAAGGDYQPGDEGGSADAVLVEHTHTATVTDNGHRHIINHRLDSSSSGNFQTLEDTSNPDEGTWSNNGLDDGNIRSQSATSDITVSNSTEGDSKAGANLPPYYALAYIIKIS